MRPYQANIHHFSLLLTAAAGAWINGTAPILCYGICEQVADILGKGAEAAGTSCHDPVWCSVIADSDLEVVEERLARLGNLSGGLLGLGQLLDLIDQLQSR